MQTLVLLVECEYMGIHTGWGDIHATENQLRGRSYGEGQGLGMWYIGTGLFTPQCLALTSTLATVHLRQSKDGGTQ